MMIPRQTFLLLCLLFAASTAAAVERIDNPAVPRDGRTTYDLREVWRVGGDDGEVIFGLVPRVETDAAGNVYILDSQMCTVSVYDRDGAFLRSIFREGEGPGEVRAPRDMVVMGDGRVGLIQEFPGAVSFVRPNGDPAGRIKVGGTSGGISSLSACQASGDVILVSGTHITNGADGNIVYRQNYMERLGDDGMTMVQFASNDTRYDFTDFRFIEREHMPTFWWCFAATPDGVVYTMPDRDRYAVEMYGADGELRRVIGREYEPLVRTDAEYEQMVGLVESAMSGVPFQPTIVMERGEAVAAYLHRALQVHPDGSLWVLTGRGVRSRLTGVMVEFDVFDDQGVFVKQVALDAPHEGQKVGVFLSGSDHVLVVKGYFESLAAQFGNGATFGGSGEEADSPEVICYEIVR